LTRLPSLQKLKSELQGQKGIVQQVRKQWLPSGEKLAKEAWKKLSFAKKDLAPEDVKKNFNDYLCRLIDTEYELYLQYEEDSLSKGVIEFVMQGNLKRRYPAVFQLINSALSTLRKKGIPEVQKLAELGSRLRPFYKLVEQSFAQGRMVRAGGSSQYHLEKLFQIIGYGSEFEKQQVLNGTVDFLFPGKIAWEKDRRKCVVVSIKRTLRERYKEVFEELDTTGGLTVYLLVTETFQESTRDISEPKVDKLNEHNIYLVVRDEIKHKRFPDKVNVIGFSEFIQKELPTKRIAWQQLLKK